MLGRGLPVSRIPVQVRDATPEDAAALLAIWGDFRRTSADRAGAPGVEAAQAVARIAADPDQRLVVGVLGDQIVGAAHLLRAQMSPIHCETAIHVTHLHVLGGHRRHGVGKALIETAVAWGEEKDTTHLLAAASVNSRDANRFMARLGLTQIAIVRGASIPALRAKLPVDPPPGARVSSRNHRSVGQVLAQRRLQRRAQANKDD
jgi:GNAT superfamily N-acetyltransferase